MRYVYLYLKDDKYTRVDTNQGSVEGKDPVTGEIISEHMRVWENSNKEEGQKNSLPHNTTKNSMQIRMLLQLLWVFGVMFSNGLGGL